MPSANSSENLDFQVVHTSGTTRIAHLPSAAGIDRLVTAGDDFLVRLLPTSPNSSAEPYLIEDATQPLTWVDVDHNYLITASEDGCVRLYNHSPQDGSPPTQLQTILRRESLPVRCVAIERSQPSSKSPRVAVCSDELIIRIVDAADPRKVQLLTGHSRAPCAASWSPVAPILITCSSDGSARVWDLASSQSDCIKVIDAILPAARADSDHAMNAVWHPSGTFFVLPSKAHELVIVSAQPSTDPAAASTSSSAPSWIRTGSFAAPSAGSVPTPSGAITAMAFCPNGRYLAVATTDGQVTVWETSSRLPVRASKAENLVTGISWHPSKDALAWTDNNGTLARWSHVLGSSYPSPFEHVEYAPATRSKRPRDEVDDLFDGTGLDDDADDVDQGVDDFVVNDLPNDHYGNTDGPSASNKRKRDRPTFVQGTKAQEAFQPASTPMRAQRRYLCYNLLGSVTAVDQDSHQSISFDSYDASARRNFRFIDHHNFSMASLGQQGILFGSKAQTETPSTVYFKPFESWNSTSAEWTLNLPTGEEVQAVALGGVDPTRADPDTDESAASGLGTAVVATSRGYLRFLSTSGMQTYVWALGQPIVTMAAGARSLVVVHRSAGGALDGFQSLGYHLIDLGTFDVIQEGVLPLARDTHVRWAGFNEHEQPSVYDSNGVLFVLDRAHRCRQGRWVPVLDTALLKEAASAAVSATEAAARAASSRNYWPIAVTSTQALVLILRGGRAHPEVDGARHLVQEVDLQIPLINRESGTGQHEEKTLRDSLLASSVRDARHAGLPAGEAFAHEMTADKASLQLIQLACKADRHARALDAARRLHSTRTLDAALQIAAFFHLPSLAERMGALRAPLADRALQADEESRRWCDPSARGGPAYSAPLPPIPDERKRLSDALAEDFPPRPPRRSFGASPISIEKENRITPEEHSPAPLPGPKPSNPFARTMVRDRSLHKSASFFERVDKPAPPSKQSTLASFKKVKPNPAFGEPESFPTDSEESLRATLNDAEERHTRPTALEETQYPDYEDESMVPEPESIPA